MVVVGSATRAAVPSARVADNGVAPAAVRATATRRQLGATLLAAALASPALHLASAASAASAVGIPAASAVGMPVASGVGMPTANALSSASVPTAAVEFWSGLIAGFVQKTAKAIHVIYV